jgi:hypothetical protein
MNGHRVADGEMRGESCFRPGAYGRVMSDGEWTWYACTPNGHLGNLGAHDVTEHDDGTITVSPSIRVSDGTGELWHGYLERGVWRLA